MSKLKVSTFALSLASLTLAACSARATPAPNTQPAATATAPVATATALPATVTAAAPTATAPAPTETAAVPTATVAAPTEPAPTEAVPATPDPNEGLGELIYADPLDGSSGWNWGFSDEAVTFGVENGQLVASMSTSAEWWRFSLGPDGLSAGNQQARVTARPVTCEGLDEYGLIFRGGERAEGGYDLYVFKLRCDGAASFEAVLDGKTTTLVDWTGSPAIQTGAEAENTLVAWMNGGEFRFYVNEQYLFSAQDATLTAGYYGFYLMDRSDGGLKVTFDDLLAREVTGVAAGQ
jgi:hypothetical protein